MVIKIKNYIKTLGFTLTDISIIPFFVFTIIFVLEDVKLMTNNEGSFLSSPLSVFITFFVLGIISLASFIIFEWLKGRKPPLVIGVVVFIFLFCSALSIFLKPNEITFNFIDLDNNPATAVISINDATKFIHFCSFSFFILSIFVWMSFFPKKFTNFSFITFICLLFYVLTFITIIYSFVNDDYVLLFQKIMSPSGDIYEFKKYLPKSFLGNPNSYAIFLELGLFITMLNHAIKRRNINYLFAVIYYAILLITMCKTAIITATILLVFHLIFVLVYSRIKKDKKETIFSSMYLGLFGVLLIVFVILYFSSELIREKINYMILKSSGFSGRKSIWYIAYQIIHLNTFIGNGHGIYNHILFNSTTIATSVGNMTSHNSFITILGEGGIIYLVAYIALIAYSLFLIIKIFKTNINIKIGTALLFGLILFLVHSTFEDLYYYVELIIVFIAISFNVIKSQPIDNKDNIKT